MRGLFFRFILNAGILFSKLIVDMIVEPASRKSYDQCPNHTVNGQFDQSMPVWGVTTREIGHF